MEDLEGLKTTDALPGEFPYLRGTKKDNNEWLVRQEIKVECPKEANAKALDILNKGVDSLSFHVKAKELNAEYIETLLKDICAECVELNFSICQGHVVELAELLVAYFQKKDYDLTKLQGSINYDYFNKMLAKGKEKGDMVATAKALLEATASLPKYRVLNVNALTLNNAGSYIFQELGYALAWGNEYMNQLVDAGLPAAMVAKKIKFNFGISSNYFLEIAKFRAARMLWANIVASYSPECLRDCDNKGKDNECRCAAKMKIHAETSSFNLTLFDAHVNLLRTQTEAMSAALAGVDSMTVTPFDKTYDAPNEFSERMARNQQLLLKEESHFDKVIDPAAGSYYIENLTVSIAKQAWDLFLAVEEDGGFYASVKAGKVQAAVNESNKARHAAVAKRKEVLLGTNQFPNFNEKAGDKKPVEATCCCGGGHTCEKDVPTLNFDRAASEFEALRLETEASGSAFHRILIERYREGSNTILAGKLDSGEEISLGDLLEAVRKEDVLCIDILEKMGVNLGKGIAGLMNIFNPELVILGGTLSLAGEYISLPIKSAIRKYSLNLVNQDTEIKISKLGERAGAFGACLLSRSKLLGMIHY